MADRRPSGAATGAPGGAARPPEMRRCPRCGAGLRCAADSGGPCDCAAVPLDRATLGRLRARYDGCLCVACLRALGAPAGQRP